MNAQPRVLVSHAQHYTDCHCACANDEDQAEPPLCFDTGISWCSHQAYTWEKLDESHVVCISPAGNGTVAVLNQASLQLLQEFSSPQTISQLRGIPFNTDSRVAAFSELVHAGLITTWPRSDYSAPDHKMLTAWLHLTNACNLRCPYCFVHHSAKRMSETVGKRAVEAAFRAAAEGSYTTVKLKYAGGEPTLAFDLVRTLHQHARLTAMQRGIGLRELLLSNGVRLTNGILQYLYAEGIQVMISLDGIGELHDRQRPTVRGSSTFAAVADAIDRCLHHRIAPDLSITVTAQNASGLAQVAEFALDRSLRFNLNFVRSDDSVSPMARRADDEALLNGVRAALQVIQRRLPPYRLIDGLLDRSTFHTTHEYACGAGRNYLAIDADGRIARCHAEMNIPVADIDDLQLLAAVRKADIPGALEPLPTSQRNGCSECRWHPWCGGGCPLQTHRATGAWDQPSPYCSIYQTILPDILRMEGLRLLKYAKMATA